MKRVVVTGMGIVSCLGNEKSSVLAALRNSQSGITFQQNYLDLGFRSHVAGSIDIDFEKCIADRKISRFMASSAGYAYISMRQAIDDAGLQQTDVSNERTGIIIGSGGASSQSTVEAADTLRNKGLKKIGPYRVTQTMGSTTSACLATPFKIKGVNYSISSACATSAHCIGNAMELIQLGKQDIMFAGGAEEVHWSLTSLFDAMGALSTNFNETPAKASRPYDANRDGFVISGGAGCLVLEELEHALKRGANIYAELVGYGATSDGYDMVSPSGEGAVRCMKQALKNIAGPIDYINAHGTSTPVGDLAELEAICQVFTENIPAVSSTKSLTGHSLGAAGVHEAIYCLLMMKYQFIAASANIENLEAAATNIPIATKRQDDVDLQRVLSNSFGFGGTNACLVFEKYRS